MFWIASKDINGIAEKMASYISMRYPPSMDQAERKGISATRLEKILENAYAMAIDFSEQKKMGWLSKARLGNAFRWRLKDLGYTSNFIDVATEGVIVYVTKGRTGKESA